MKITGPAAIGEAGVLGSSTNPIGIYMQNQRQRQQQEYFQEQEARKKRDALIDYTATYNPLSKWAVRQGEITQMAQQLRGYTQHRLHQGIPAEQIRMEQAQMEGMINNRMAEHQVWMKTYEDAYAKIIADPKYGKGAKSKLNDIFFKHDMTATDPDYVRQNIGNIDHEIMYNPELMNESVVAKKFVDGMEEQNRQTYGKIPDAQGVYLTEEKLAGKLPYARNAKGEVIIDPHTQQPFLDVNDNLYTLAMGSQDMRLMMQKQGGDTKAGQIEWLKKTLPIYDKVSYEKKIKEGFKKSEGERTAGETVTAANERFQNTEKMVNNFRPDLLAAVFDPRQPNRAEYITNEGKPVVGYDEVTKTYFMGDGTTTTKEPTKIRVTIKHGGLAGDFAAVMLKDDFLKGRITKDQLDEKLRALTESAGKEDTRIFDRTTKQGKRVLHQIISRMQDEFLPPKERLGEGYSKTISEHYDKETDPLGILEP